MSDIGLIVRVGSEFGVVLASRAGEWRVAPAESVAPAVAAAAAGVEVGPDDLEEGSLPGGSVVLAGRAAWMDSSACRPAGRVSRNLVDRALRAAAKDAARQYYDFAHAPKPFTPGSSPAPVSGRVWGAEEMESLTDASLDFWLTTGRFNDAFEKRLAGFLGTKSVLTCNSGSSANLLAVAALTSHKLGDRALKPGDEVVTVAAGFPTTVNPLLIYGLVPVFVDVHIPTYQIRPDLIEAAVSPRTKAIVIAHTLGNSFDLDEVMRVAEKHGLWVVEDCCDALGAMYRPGGGEPRRVGTFGHLATFSFYPAHHITMGEGGAVAVNDGKLRSIVESFRDWGRDCWCPPGCDNTCGRRFDWKLGELPHGYDHKYVYSHVGYNLKITDMQAAVALSQMDRLDGFIAARQRNFARMTERLSPLSDVLILPEATPKSEPSWFGYPVTLAGDHDREELMRFLNGRKIGTRLLFGGNLVRQPYFTGREYRVAPGGLEATDRIMNRTFWLGVYPGLTEAHVDYIAGSVETFFGRRT